MPGLYVRSGGVWTEITTVAPQVKNAGVWVNTQEVWVRNSGTWVKVWPNIVSPVPSNLRFGTEAWANGRYEVQVIWDPINDATVYDKYQLEVTRVGGANPVTAQVIDIAVGTNFYNDISVGTTAGIQLQYRVRSSKSGVASAWSGYINVTTPADAGFCKATWIAPVGDFYGNMYMQVQHDGNAQNYAYQLYRMQNAYYDWTYIRTYYINATTMNLVDAIGADHYRGPYAGTTNTVTCWPETVTWTVRLIT